MGTGTCTLRFNGSAQAVRNNAGLTKTTSDVLQRF
jgi:hypothetical protein